MILGTLNPEKIRHENPTDLSTSPVRGNHFTFGNPKRVIFNSIIHTYFWLFTLSHKKQTVIHLLTPPENVTTLTCELRNFFIWLKVCCVLSNVGGSEDSQCCGCRRWLRKELVVMCGNWNGKQRHSKCSKWPSSAWIRASSLFRHLSLACCAEIQPMSQQAAATTRLYQHSRSSCSVPRRSTRAMQVIGSTKQ